MSLQGLPDFQQPLLGDGFRVYFPYEAKGSHVVVPSGLEVATRNDGKPDFVLNMVRGANPLLPPKPYGMLDFRLRPQYRMEEALELARVKAPWATLAYPAFSSSFLKFQPAADTGDFPADLRAPVTLGWNGLETARFMLRVSADAASILKQCLLNEVGALLVTALLEMQGVSPRVPLTIRLQPRELLSALAALGENFLVTRDDIVAFFRNEPRNLPVKVDGELNDTIRDDFAEGMADLVRIRYASPAAAPTDASKEYFSLTPPEKADPGTVECDLAEPRAVSRGIPLRMDPFASAKQLVASEGIGAVVHESVVPPIESGTHQVWITANLPAERPGLLASGVTLKAPAAPPFRLQPITVTAEFQPPADSGAVVLRLSPKEELQYSYATFVVLESGGSVNRLDGSATVHSGDRLDLTLTDFPVDFWPVSASEALLKIATVGGVLRGEDWTVPFNLTADRPSIAVPYAKGAVGLTVEVEARAKDGSGILHIARGFASSLALDLSSFAEYGTHTVDVECDFSAGAASLAAVDLLPQGNPDTAEAIAVLAFTPAKPRKQWTYAARSPFQPGYRYRLHVSADEQTAPWSEVRQSGEILRITAPVAASSPAGAPV